MGFLHTRDVGSVITNNLLVFLAMSLFSLGFSQSLLAVKTKSKSMSKNNHAVARSVHWALTGGIGYTNFENMYQSEGQTVVERIAFDAELIQTKYALLGLELGAQNGNTMLLNVDKERLDELGGSVMQTTVKPTLDLLATCKIPILNHQPLFAMLRGGAAYRRWQFDDRATVNFLANIAGELQAGLGVTLGEHASIDLVYQGIWGGNPNFQVNLSNETGTVSNIAIQNGLLLNLSYYVA